MDPCKACDANRSMSCWEQGTTFKYVQMPNLSSTLQESKQRESATHLGPSRLVTMLLLDMDSTEVCSWKERTGQGSTSGLDLLEHEHSTATETQRSQSSLEFKHLQTYSTCRRQLPANNAFTKLCQLAAFLSSSLAFPGFCWLCSQRCYFMHTACWQLYTARWVSSRKSAVPRPLTMTYKCI